MKKIFLSVTILSGFTAIAQTTDYSKKIGINTSTPQATLDISATTTDGSKIEGLLIPRISRLAAQTMGNSQTEKPLESTLIYINDISTGTLASSTINVSAVGYYYFDGTLWQKLNSSSVYTAGVGIQTIGTDNVIKSEFVDKVTEGSSTGYRVLGTDGTIADANYGNIGDRAIDFSIQDAASTNGATGQFSFAAGHKTIASKRASVAFGRSTTASNDSSFASGYGTTASGDKSFAANNNSIASGSYSAAFGESTNASARESFAINNRTTASGDSSFAAGKSTKAAGTFSFATGDTSTASGIASFTAGISTIAENKGEAAFGFYNSTIGSISTDAAATNNKEADVQLFSIGNGTSSSDTSNALVIMRDGKTGINTGRSAPTETLDVNGSIKVRGTNYSNISQDAPCNSNLGTITFVDDTFWGCTSKGWKQLNN